jgi:hypothetical protein
MYKDSLGAGGTTKKRVRVGARAKIIILFFSRLTLTHALLSIHNNACKINVLRVLFKRKDKLCDGFLND